MYKEKEWRRSYIYGSDVQRKNEEVLRYTKKDSRTCTKIQF